MSPAERELIEQAAATLRIPPRSILSARVRQADEWSEPVLIVVTAAGQKLRLCADGTEILKGPASAGAPVRVAAPLPLPAEEPDDLPPLLEESDVAFDSAGDPLVVPPREDHWEVFKGDDGDWYIRRIAPNGEPVAISEGHVNRSDAYDEAVREARDPDLVRIV
jgi:uncharacterized protein YegP (UPF0339 family)